MTRHPSLANRPVLYYTGSLQEYFGQTVVSFKTQRDGRLEVLLESGVLLGDCRPSSITNKPLRSVPAPAEPQRSHRLVVTPRGWLVISVLSFAFGTFTANWTWYGGWQ